MKTLNWIQTIIFVSMIAACASPPSAELSPSDKDALKHASQAYAKAWLSNDAEAVMATFVEEPVLSPSGLPYLEGQAAARAFWWPPESPAAVVTKFEVQELEVSGSGNLGYVRGVFTLGFDYDGESYSNRGKFVHILSRGENGTWRISHHLWNDLPKQDE